MSSCASTCVLGIDSSNSYCLYRSNRCYQLTKPSNERFHFGSGDFFPSECHAIIPIYVGQSRYELGVDVVSCTIPLLLSRDTLQKAKAQIDIAKATIRFMGATVSMGTSSSGHLCLDIGRSYDVSNTETKRVLLNVLFTSPFLFD